MSSKYDLAVVIGRFEPFHNIHFKLVAHALSIADKVIILLGSHASAPNVKNPFNSSTREGMIKSCYKMADSQRLIFRPIRDIPYSYNAWLAEAQILVRREQEQILVDKNYDYDVTLKHEALGKVKTTVVGHFKDHTSYYLKDFKQWDFEPFFERTKESQILNATDIRALYFDGNSVDEFVPAPVAAHLRSFRDTQPFKELKAEFDYYKQYHADSRFVGMPFDPVFVTTDAVVTASGHILLVRRGARPGKGLLALPGGFLDKNLLLIDNVKKELREETQMRGVDFNELTPAATHVFDYPFRSLRGRTITHGYLFELHPNLKEGMPTVKGGDDASGADWYAISSLADYETSFFEDHLDIIRYFVGV